MSRNLRATDIPSLYGIRGRAADDVWAVGWDGTILHWDGERWTNTPTGTSAPLGGVCADAPGHAWAFGADGVILEYRGDAWIRHLTATRVPFLRGHATQPEDMWAIAEPGHVIHWDGKRWSSIALEKNGTWNRLYGVWGSSPNDVWLAGERLLHWDGERFEQHYSSDVFGTMRGVWGSRPDDIWCVGSHGMVARFDGDSWRRVDFPLDHELRAVWGTSS